MIELPNLGTQPHVTETVYLHDNGNPWDLYRIKGIVDLDGIFYATCDRHNPETNTWQPTELTQWQRDETTVCSIADNECDILDWFGFTQAEIISRDQLPEGTPND